MADFDPEKFEDKYANYFPQLQGPTRTRSTR